MADKNSAVHHYTQADLPQGATPVPTKSKSGTAANFLQGVAEAAPHRSCHDVKSGVWGDNAVKDSPVGGCSCMGSCNC